MASTPPIDALREQASFVMRYERLDVPKRVLSLALGMGCLIYFDAPEEAQLNIGNIYMDHPRPFFRGLRAHSEDLGAQVQGRLLPDARSSDLCPYPWLGR